MYKLKILWAAWRAKKYWKKSFGPESKYNLQFRNDFTVKKIKSLMKSLKIKIEVEGYDNLGFSGPCMLYGNHQDNFDPLALIYALKAQTEAKDDYNKVATFIAKHSLQYKWYTRYPLNNLDTFFLDRDDVKKSLEVFDQFGKFVKDNKTYGTIFPEGTRNKSGSIDQFKPGAFKIVKKELIPIVPFTIINSVGAFDSTRKNELIIKVVFHKKLSPHSFATQNTIALAERVQKIVASAFVKPDYQYQENEKDNDVENSKAAQKWWKKQEKKEKKQQKKLANKTKQEQKTEAAVKKEDEKYERALEKKLKKNKDK